MAAISEIKHAAQIIYQIWNGFPLLITQGNSGSLFLDWRSSLIEPGRQFISEEESDRL